MKLFLLAGSVPSGRHGVRAASMVVFHLAAELLRRGHPVTLQLVLNEARREWTHEEREDFDELRRLGVETPDVFFRTDYESPRAPGAIAALRRVLARRLRPLEAAYPALRLRERMGARIAAAGAEAALVVWSAEGLAATYGLRSVPRLAYYGMPDHAAALARIEDPELFGLTLSASEQAAERRRLARLEALHLALMRDCDAVANLSAEHAEYYERQGHPRSLYVQNLWPAPAPGAPTSPPPEADGRLRILGNLGRPAATGNTYGLRFLAAEIVPRLDAALGAEGYEIHLLGSGRPTPQVEELLRRARSVRVRGWVEDVDAEIRAAQVFLVANNANRYRGSHTRFLHAWSLEACCVGHGYNARANPEMVHGENVLLGDSADAIASWVVSAATDAELRRKVGKGGFETYMRHFTPQAVVGRLTDELERLVASGRRG